VPGWLPVVRGGVMFEDSSEDVPRTYDDEPTGQSDTQWSELLSERHRQLLALLYANSHRDRAGRLVSWWLQPKLAAKLGVSVRTLQNLLADLREPGRDPRHPRGQPAGLRLGLVKVETTSRPGEAGGGRLLAGNLYVLVDRQIPRSLRHATPKAALTSADGDDVACLNKSTTPSLEGKGELESLTGVGGAENDDVWPAFADSRWYSGPGRGAAPPAPLDPLPERIEIPIEPSAELLLDYDPGLPEILAALERGFEPVQVEHVWPNDLVGPPDAFHKAVDQLGRATCLDGGCQPRQPCRRHARRKRT
jgi:hypothetical protein